MYRLHRLHLHQLGIQIFILFLKSHKVFDSFKSMKRLIFADCTVHRKVIFANMDQNRKKNSAESFFRK